MAETYATWTQQHSTIFGFSADEANMLVSWVKMFAREGFTPEELVAATNRLALAADPVWRRDHCNALVSLVRDGRKKAIQAPPMPDDRGRHDLCGGTGLVIVPHPKTLRGETEQWYNFAVTCTCPLGLWKAECFKEYHESKNKKRAKNDQKASLSYADYCLEFMNWRDYVAEHEQLMQSRREASSISESRDRAHGPLAKPRVDLRMQPVFEKLRSKFK